MRLKEKPILNKFYAKKINLSTQLFFCNSVKEAVKNADLIQENAPENEKLKIKIIKDISLNAKKNAIIASSSSGLLPSKITI